MQHFGARQKGETRRLRKSKPRLEGLEDRFLLYSTTGGAFALPDRITFSFAPDGTDVGGTPSSLYSTFNGQVSNWQGVFQQAAAIWEQVANINLVMVSDNGAPMGSGNYRQGDPNNGDIRISAIPQGSSTLASAFMPPSLNGGPVADDIVFNSNQNWTSRNGYDLLSVAIHELGHALGLGHSSTTSADMYAYYTTSKSALSTDDISGIKAIYGARQADSWTANYQNTTISNAANITSQIDTNSQISLTNLDITSATVSNWFKVTVPSSSTGTMTVTMQSTNISELSPRVQVYNSAQTSMGYATDAGSYGSTVRVTLNNIVPGQVYYIKTSAAGSGATGAGDYALQLNFGSQAQAPITPPNVLLPNQQSSGSQSLGETGFGGGILGRLLLSVDDLLTITLGTLSGVGDHYSVRPRVARQHAFHSKPAPVHHHAVHHFGHH